MKIAKDPLARAAKVSAMFRGSQEPTIDDVRLATAMLLAAMEPDPWPVSLRKFDFIEKGFGLIRLEEV